MSAPYSSRYYEQIKEDSAVSAREVVPIIVQLFRPRSIVDVGCGSGTWTREYAASGCEVLGIDGDQIRSEQLVIPVERFARRDLEQPFQLERRFDLANCLEVAEHLRRRAEGIVADLCRLADVIVFSAAVPGQGGTHHVNEQWPSYWIAQFARHGFDVFDCLRPRIWRNENVAWWYNQNLFAFIHRSRCEDFPATREPAQPWPTDLVRPRAYVRATVPSQMSPRMLREVVRALPHFPRKVLAHLRHRSG